MLYTSWQPRRNVVRKCRNQAEKLFYFSPNHFPKSTLSSKRQNMPCRSTKVIESIFIVVLFVLKSFHRSYATKEKDTKLSLEVNSKQKNHSRCRSLLALTIQIDYEFLLYFKTVQRHIAAPAFKSGAFC